jgi:hypothetical protein
MSSTRSVNVLRSELNSTCDQIRYETYTTRRIRRSLPWELGLF